MDRIGICCLNATCIILRPKLDEEQGDRYCCACLSGNSGPIRDALDNVCLAMNCREKTQFLYCSEHVKKSPKDMIAQRIKQLEEQNSKLAERVMHLELRLEQMFAPGGLVSKVAALHFRKDL